MNPVATLTKFAERLRSLSETWNRAEAKALKVWLLDEHIDVTALTIKFLDGVLAETKVLGGQLLQRWENRIALQSVLLSDSHLDIPSDESANICWKGTGVRLGPSVAEGPSWFAAYMAGTGITAEEFKQGLSDDHLATLITGYTNKLKESDNDMFMAGVSTSSISDDNELLVRYANITGIQKDLYALKTFCVEFTEYQLEDFAHYLAGYGYEKITILASLDQLRQLRKAREISGADDSMAAFIHGFIASEK